MFIERFAEFSNLLDEEHSLVFTQLQQDVKHMSNGEIKHTNKKNNKNVKVATSTKARTDAEIGDEHIDNERDALKKLDTPDYETIDVYSKKLKKKICDMIDGLIKHLRNSRKKLTKDEIKSAEDFAVFQSCIYKENKYLKRSIIRLTLRIKKLEKRIKKAKATLKNHMELLQKAINKLNMLILTCKQKDEYHKKEVARMESELNCVDQAFTIFKSLMKNISKRVKQRTNSNIQGKEYSEENANTSEVEDIKAATNKQLSKRVSERNSVAFSQIESLLAEE